MSVKNILKTIFSHEAIIVIIKGYWKTGKTNVGLLLAEMLLELNLVKIVATNIKIKETDKIKFIEDMKSLKEFHYDDPVNPKHKLFIFDEAGKLAVRRGAMRKENVEWMKFLPELSKGRMKLIVITQSEKFTDSIFTETEFTRAIITTRHHKKYGYSFSVESELLVTPMIYINKLPKCEIEYSPYSPAEWFQEPRIINDKSEELYCCKIARMYAIDDKSTTVIANEENLSSRKQVTRILKRHIRHTLGIKLSKEDIVEAYNALEQPDISDIPDEIPVITIKNDV